MGASINYVQLFSATPTQLSPQRPPLPDLHHTALINVFACHLFHIKLHSCSYMGL